MHGKAASGQGSSACASNRSSSEHCIGRAAHLAKFAHKPEASPKMLRISVAAPDLSHCRLDECDHVVNVERHPVRDTERLKQPFILSLNKEGAQGVYHQDEKQGGYNWVISPNAAAMNYTIPHSPGMPFRRIFKLAVRRSMAIQEFQRCPKPLCSRTSRMMNCQEMESKVSAMSNLSRKAGRRLSCKHLVD